MYNKILVGLIFILCINSPIIASVLKVPKKITYDIGNCQDLINNLDTCMISKCTLSMSLDENKILYKYNIKEYKNEKCIVEKYLILRDEEQRPLVFSEICSLSNEGRKIIIGNIINQLNGKYESLLAGNKNHILKNECKAK